MAQNYTTGKSRKFYWLLFISTVIIVFFLGLLASSIIQRKSEKDYVFKPKAEINAFEPRNQVWGLNFPREYQSYMKTSDTSFRSKYNGNAMIDMLAVDPRLVVLWAGYGFAKDYNQGRGHSYAILDIRNTLRTGGPKEENDGPQPSTCWACKSSDIPRLVDQLGPVGFYTGKWAKFGSEIVNPIGCLDCHDPESMNLRISRPALIEAFARTGKDVTKVSHQEMRSLVCAQCHVEYYFDKKHEGAPDANYLTFPWDKGTTVDDIEKYYDEYAFSDWEHALSKAPMLKAQHPDYEIFMSGVHAQRGVSCADCHMPYHSEGGQKFTDHHIQSPLNNVANSCQVCHREETMKLVNDVYERQEKIITQRDKLEELLVRAHVEAKTAWDKGANADQMKDILQDIRHAQWRWDFAAAGHGSAFHAPLETMRIVLTGITNAQDARIKLARLLLKLGFDSEVPYPDIQTKAKAQEYIGLDMKKLKEEKESFLKNIIPVWDQKAKDREALMKIQYL